MVTLTYVGVGCVPRISHTALLRRQGTSMPKLSWDLYVRAHAVRNRNPILHGDQTILGEFLLGRPLHLSSSKMYVTNADCDLFAVANLLVLALAVVEW